MTKRDTDNIRSINKVIMKKNDIYDESEHRFYILYINNKMYGWTENKLYKDLFLAQRKKNLFTVKKKVLDHIAGRAFMSKYKSQEIIEIPLQDGKKDFMIMGTYQEDSKFGDYCEYLRERLESLDRYFTKMEDSIPSKYHEAIDTLLGYRYVESEYGSVENVFDVNAVSIFFSLFKNTF